MAQQIPLPKASSPYLDNRPGALEHLEPETDDDIDIRDYMERPAKGGDLQNPNVDLV